MFQNTNLLFVLHHLGGNFKLKYKNERLKTLKKKKVFDNICSFLDSETIFEVKYV
jgi:hypothetical protein